MKSAFRHLLSCALLFLSVHATPCFGQFAVYGPGWPYIDYSGPAIRIDPYTAQSIFPNPSGTGWVYRPWYPVDTQPDVNYWSDDGTGHGDYQNVYTHPPGRADYNDVKTSSAAMVGPIPSWIEWVKAELGGSVILATGAEEFSRSMLQVQGVRNLNFEVRYSSLDARIRQAKAPLARGWTSSFDVEAYVDWQGIGYVRFGSSGVIRFTQTNGIWTCVTEGVKQAEFVRVGNSPIILKYGDGSRLEFGNDGKISRDIDPSGNAIEFTYNNGMLLMVTDAATQKFIAFNYDGIKRLVHASDNLNRTVGFVYSPGGSLAQIKDARDKTTSYAYDTRMQMTEVRDHENNVITANVYDSSGRITKQTDAKGKFWLFAYQNSTVSATDREGRIHVYGFNSKGRCIYYTNPLGQTVYYVTQSSGLVTKAMLPSGRWKDFSYGDGNNMTSVSVGGYNTSIAYANNGGRNTGLPASITSPGNRTTTISRDPLNRPVSISGPDETTFAIQYSPTGQPTAVYGTGGSRVDLTYSQGMPDSITTAGGIQTMLGYDSVGRQTSTALPGGREYFQSFDANNNLLSISGPGNKTVSTSYDSRSRPVLTTLPDGTKITRQFDPNHNLISETDSIGRVTTYVYDAEDRLISATLPGNRTVTLTRDFAGKVVSIASPAGRVTSFGYDVDGNLVSVAAPDGTTQTTVYDAASLPSALIDAETFATNLTRNQAGEVASITSPEYRVRSFLYDPAGRLTRTTMPSGKFSTVTHDETMRRFTVTDLGGRQTTHDFDVDGRPVAVTTPGGHSTTYTYGTDGNLAIATLPSGKTVQFEYGADGSTSSITDGSGTTTFTRDIMGRVTSTSKGNQTVSRTYDALGRVLTYTDAAGNTVAYAYDTAGNLASITYPDTTQVTYQYDADGVLVRVTDWEGRVTQITPDIAGRPTLIELPNGTRNGFSYTPTGRIANIVSTGPGMRPIVSRLMTFTPDGLTSSESGMPTPTSLPPDAKMTFDADNRITTYNGGNVTYDVDGNMLSIPTGGSTLSATFDAAGRLTVAGNVTSSYDPEGRRTKITDSTGESNLVYDTLPSLDRILVKMNPDGSVTKYVHGNGLLYEVTGSALRAYHYDSRGSTIALTDAAGVVTDTFSYGPYGETWSRTGTTNTPLRFCGQYGIQTDMNGLLSMRARFYSPEIKRFVSQDSYLGSAMNPLSLNRYSYAECNPISLIDPTGFAAMDFWYQTSNGWTDIILWTKSPEFLKIRQSSVNLMIGENGGEAWGAMLYEPWEKGPTGGVLPVSIAKGMNDIRKVLPLDASANGMHAWHSGSNAYLAHKLGLIGAPLIIFGGIIHETPLDFESFSAELDNQGLLNHMLDSLTDIFANSTGMHIGYIYQGDVGVMLAVEVGNHIPGPGEPDPAFGGHGKYRGNPTTAWGQYPE